METVFLAFHGPGPLRGNREIARGKRPTLCHRRTSKPNLAGKFKISLISRACNRSEGGAAKRSVRIVQGRSVADIEDLRADRKSTRLNSSHRCISYAVFC